MFLHMWRIVAMLKRGHATSHCPSFSSKESLCSKLERIRAACALLSPPSPLSFVFSFTATFWLLHSRTYISAEQTTFSKCFYEYRSSSVRYVNSLLWFSSYPISMFKVSFSILISFIIQSLSILTCLFALYYRWSSTNLWWSSFSSVIVLPIASKIKKSSYA